MPASKSEVMINGSRAYPGPLIRPVLLPGGRWMIGISGARLEWYISCWDVQATSNSQSPLVPSASYQFDMTEERPNLSPTIQHYEYNDHDGAFNILIQSVRYTTRMDPKYVAPFFVYALSSAYH